MVQPDLSWPEWPAVTNLSTYRLDLELSLIHI